MENVYRILDKLLYSADENSILTALPEMNLAVSELVKRIKAAESYKDAEQSMMLLHVAIAPLNALIYKYGHENDAMLKALPRDIFMFENVFDEISKQTLYKAVREGRILSDI